MSQTYFSRLELSGNFDLETSVFPQSVFTDLQLVPELEKVLPDGRIILNLDGDENKENVAPKLFGLVRKFVLIWFQCLGPTKGRILYRNLL